MEVILPKARSAKWFSIMADECTDVANLEQMAVCIRFVDPNNIVNEEFIGFIPLDKVDAASITTAVRKKMEVCKLHLRNLRDQGSVAFLLAATLIGTTSSIIPFQLKDIYSIYRWCWKVTTYKCIKVAHVTHKYIAQLLVQSPLIPAIIHTLSVMVLQI